MASREQKYKISLCISHSESLCHRDYPLHVYTQKLTKKNNTSQLDYDTTSSSLGVKIAAFHLLAMDNLIHTKYILLTIVFSRILSLCKTLHLKDHDNSLTITLKWVKTSFNNFGILAISQHYLILCKTNQW